MGNLPEVANISVGRVPLQAGDKLLVKVHQDLTNTQRERLYRCVKKWAGTEVDILIIDSRTTDIEVVRHP
jgi:hypothetical protein